MQFWIKHQMEELKEGIVKNSHWQDTCGKKFDLLFLSEFFLSFSEQLKKGFYFNCNVILVTKREIYFDSLMSPSHD